MEKIFNFVGLIISITGFGVYLSEFDMKSVVVFFLLILVFLNLVPTKNNKNERVLKKENKRT